MLLVLLLTPTSVRAQGLTVSPGYYLYCFGPEFQGNSPKEKKFSFIFYDSHLMTFIKELLSTKNLFPRKSKRLIRLRPKQGITKTSGRHAELQLLPQPLKQPSTSTDEGRFSIWVTGHSGQILAHLYGDK